MTQKIATQVRLSKEERAALEQIAAEEPAYRGNLSAVLGHAVQEFLEKRNKKGRPI